MLISSNPLIWDDFIKIKETLGIAELFYKSSFKSIKEIPLINRFAILVARRVYREIGNNILRKKDLENYNKSGKIFVNKIGKSAADIRTEIKMNGWNFSGLLKFNINIPKPIEPYNIIM